MVNYNVRFSIKILEFDYIHFHVSRKSNLWTFETIYAVRNTISGTSKIVVFEVVESTFKLYLVGILFIWKLAMWDASRIAKEPENQVFHEK